MKNYDLLVIGNGFDLACKYKTTYVDFLNSFENGAIPNNLVGFFSSAHYNDFMNGDWNDFEKCILLYLRFIEYIFTNQQIKVLYPEPKIDYGGHKFLDFATFIIDDISKMPNDLIGVFALINPLYPFIRFFQDKYFTIPFKNFEEPILSNTIYIKISFRLSQINADKMHIRNFLLKKSSNI